MSMTLLTTTRFEERARELMHQSALLTLDLATGRSREEVLGRLEAAAIAIAALRQGLYRGDPLPTPEPGSYWERFTEGKRRVCEKCVYFRSGYVAEASPTP